MQSTGLLTKLKITPRQEEFCIAYLMGKSAAEAALIAGYTEKTATRAAHAMLEKEPMRTYIAERKARQNVKITATREWKIQKLEEVIMSALIGDAMYDKDGNIVGNKIDRRSAIAAINELNKMCGDHSAEKHININANADIDLDTVRELVRKARQDF